MWWSFRSQVCWAKRCSASMRSARSARCSCENQDRRVAGLKEDIMAVIALKGLRRERLGKGGARTARREGNIPAVLYGHGEDPVSVNIGARDFDLALRGHKGGNPIVNLAVDSKEF